MSSKNTDISSLEICHPVSGFKVNILNVTIHVTFALEKPSTIYASNGTENITLVDNHIDCGVNGKVALGIYGKLRNLWLISQLPFAKI